MLFLQRNVLDDFKDFGVEVLFHRYVPKCLEILFHR